MGLDIENTFCSTSTVGRCRRENRKKGADRMRSVFHSENNLTSDYDGKAFIKLDVKEEKLALIVSGGNGPTVLWIPQVTAGTSECHFEETYKI